MLETRNLEAKYPEYIIKPCNLQPCKLIGEFNNFLVRNPLISFENILTHYRVKTFENVEWLKGVDENFDSVLGTAASTGNYHVLLKIAEIIGIELLNVGNMHCLTPLHLAAKAKNCNLSYIITAYLINKGAEVNAISHWNQGSGFPHLHSSPLTEAVDANNIATAILLLKHGAISDWITDDSKQYSKNEIFKKRVCGNIQKAKKYITIEKLLLASRGDKGSAMNVFCKDIFFTVLKMVFLISCREISPGLWKRSKNQNESFIGK